MGRPCVCQCEIRAAQTLWRTALQCCFREWSGEEARVRPSAGSVFKKLHFWRGPLICVEQATFVLYLHSCWIGWDELWSLFWFAEGLMRRWAKMPVKPQKPSAPETVVSFFWMKEAKLGWECAWPQREHQSHLERRGGKDPELSFTGVPTNIVASFMHNIV